jgi:hypothetical protein
MGGSKVVLEPIEIAWVDKWLLVVQTIGLKGKSRAFWRKVLLEHFSFLNQWMGKVLQSFTRDLLQFSNGILFSAY